MQPHKRRPASRASQRSSSLSRRRSSLNLPAVSHGPIPLPSVTKHSTRPSTTRSSTSRPNTTSSTSSSAAFRDEIHRSIYFREQALGMLDQAAARFRLDLPESAATLQRVLSGYQSWTLNVIESIATEEREKKASCPPQALSEEHARYLVKMATDTQKLLERHTAASEWLGLRLYRNPFMIHDESVLSAPQTAVISRVKEDWGWYKGNSLAKQSTHDSAYHSLCIGSAPPTTELPRVRYLLISSNG